MLRSGTESAYWARLSSSLTPIKGGLSDALREMVTVADTEEWEGKKQAWTGILDNELSQGKQIQADSPA